MNNGNASFRILICCGVTVQPEILFSQVGGCRGKFLNRMWIPQGNRAWMPDLARFGMEADRGRPVAGETFAHSV